MDNNLISRNLEEEQEANLRQKWLFGSRLSGKMAYIYELAAMRGDSASGERRNKTTILIIGKDK